MEKRILTEFHIVLVVASLPANSQGNTSLLAGIRASSVKSIFTRFAQNTLTVNNLHGKFNSFNPSISSINFSIGGLKYPQTPINPLLSPSQSYRETQIAVGSFNSTQFTSSIPPTLYCRLSAGSTVWRYASAIEPFRSSSACI